MTANRVVISVVVFAAMAFGQRHKPVIDPETKEGYVIQLIQQERDPAEKLKQIHAFVAEFPKSPSLVWAYDQLLAAARAAQDWPGVFTSATKLLELDPQSLDAAHAALEAAETAHDAEQVRHFAVVAWKLAAADPKDAYSQQVMAYAEYTLAAIAADEHLPSARKVHLQTLESLNPKSPWLNHSAPAGFSTLAQGLSHDKLVTLAVKMLSSEPNNEDMLMVVADYHMQRGDAPDLVLDFSSRVLEILRTKDRPADVSAADWERKKENYLGAAHYMVGVISSMQGRYVAADRNLRAALPSIRNSSSQVLGATLYHLGYANYQLAEKGERPRIFDALKFTEQCATVPSSFQNQAAKNIDSIKSEYNLR